jgi:HSP20 family molecular chaperone IbpA
LALGVHSADLLARERSSPTPGALSLALRPVTNIWEAGDRIGIEIELAGCHPEDVSLVVVQDRVTVRFARRPDHAGEPRRVHLAERFLGPLSRTFTLPSPVRADTAVLVFQHGLLTALFDKALEGTQPRTTLCPRRLQNPN